MARVESHVFAQGDLLSGPASGEARAAAWGQLGQSKPQKGMNTEQEAVGLETNPFLGSKYKRRQLDNSQPKSFLEPQCLQSHSFTPLREVVSFPQREYLCPSSFSLLVSKSPFNSHPSQTLDLS